MKIRLALLTTTVALTGAAPAQAIIRGTPTDTATLPWMVSLVAAGQDARSGLFCGGSMIAPDAVLTAAHCVEDTAPEAISAIVGRTRLSDEGVGDRVGVRSIEVVPGAEHSFVPDVAVLRLTRRLPNRTVPLAAAGDTSLTRTSAPTFTAGWGLVHDGGGISDRLRMGAARVSSTRTCRGAYGSDFKARVMLCANGSQSHCNGDSGGPVLGLGETGPVQVGIVSFGGERCADRSSPAVAARVGALRGFIDAATRR